MEKSLEIAQRTLQKLEPEKLLVKETAIIEITEIVPETIKIEPEIIMEYQKPERRPKIVQAELVQNIPIKKEKTKIEVSEVDFGSSEFSSESDISEKVVEVEKPVFPNVVVLQKDIENVEISEKTATIEKYKISAGSTAVRNVVELKKESKKIEVLEKVEKMFLLMIHKHDFTDDFTDDFKPQFPHNLFRFKDRH